MTRQSRTNGADHVTPFDQDINTTQYNQLITGIGFAPGTEGVTVDLTGKGLTRYRVKCNAECRFIEDAINLLQAQAWLQSGAAETPGEQKFRKAPANEWSEWQEFPDSHELTNIYVSLNSAGTNQTATVEAE